MLEYLERFWSWIQSFWDEMSDDDKKAVAEAAWGMVMAVFSAFYKANSASAESA